MQKPNRYGKGKVPVATTLPAEAMAQLRAQAAATGLSSGAYARRLLMRGLRKPIRVIEVDEEEFIAGKGSVPPDPAPTARGRAGTSTFQAAPGLNEHPAKYRASRRGSPPSAQDGPPRG